MSTRLCILHYYKHIKGSAVSHQLTSRRREDIDEVEAISRQYYYLLTEFEK